MKRILKLTAFLSLFLTLAFTSGFSKTKRSQSPWMGIDVKSVTAKMADQYEMEVDYGVMIEDVVRNSPADDANLEEDDIIIAFNGKKVFDTSDLFDFLEDASVDDVVDLTIYRDSKKMNVKVTLGSIKESKRDRWYDDDEDVLFFNSPNKIKKIVTVPDISKIKKYKTYSNKPYIGVFLSDLSDQLGDYFGVENGRGVLVTEVVEDSPAEKTGLMAGDIITAIDNEKTYDYEDLTDILRDFEPGDEIELSIVRNKQTKTVKLTLDENDNYGGNYYYNYPDFAINIPKISGVYSSNFWHDDEEGLNFILGENDLDDALDDLEEFYEDIDEFNEELDDMKDEINEDLREEIEQYLKNFDEFEDELDDHELRSNKKLQKEMRQLKKEVSKLRKRL